MHGIEKGRVEQIEGLRAVCVLLVVVFHINPDVLPGGYLGVDAFFAISGYVITRMISRQYVNGSFSLRNFYISRAVRLMPALMVTTLVTVVGFWFLYSAYDFKHLLQSAIASALSVSNIYFYFDAGYFSGAAIYKPLLHTWSLGVEEQFYIIWPITAVLLLRRRMLTPAFLAGIAIVSCAATLWYSQVNPDLTFYLSPFRIYQFMLGGLAAMLVSRISGNLKFMPAASAAAAWLIIPAMVALSFPKYGLGFEQTIAQGVMALIVAAGCGVFELAERHASPFSPLRLKPMVLLGTRSYSVYLAHWPVILAILALKGTGHEISLSWQVAAFALSIIAGFALAQLVERPIRLKSSDAHLVRGLKMGATAGLVSTSLAATGIALLIYSGPSRAPAAPVLADAATSELEAPVQNDIEYLRKIRNAANQEIDCRVSLKNDQLTSEDLSACMSPNKRNILIIGDSYSWDLYRALHARQPETNYVILFLDGCPPYFGDDAAIKSAMAKHLAPCQIRGGDPWRTAREWIESIDEKPDVVLTGNWNYMGLRSQDIEANFAWLASLPNRTAMAGNRPTFKEEVWRLVEAGDVDPQDKNDLTPYVATQGYGANQVAVTEKMNAMASQFPGVYYISLYELFCPNFTCRAFEGRDLLYIDRDHISLAGSDWIARTGKLDAFLAP